MGKREKDVWQENRTEALLKIERKEPFDVKNSRDQFMIWAVARYEAQSLISNQSLERCRYWLITAANRRSLGRKTAEGDIQKEYVLAVDKKAYIDFYAEHFYNELTNGLMQKLGIMGSISYPKMPWGDWEFDMSDVVHRHRIEDFAKERVLEELPSSDTAQVILEYDEADLEESIKARSKSALPFEFWTSDEELFHRYYDSAFRAHFLIELRKLAGVVSTYEDNYIRTTLTGIFNTLEEEIQEKEKQQASQKSEQERKKQELFPEPEPIQERRAGATIHFTTDEAAILVYVDCSQSGKQLEISCPDLYINNALRETKRNKADVITRTSDNRSVCSAIFSRIPFVTARHRNEGKALKYVECTVKLGSLEQSIMLTKGELLELDWQAETKPETPATQTTSTIETPSNQGTLQSKQELSDERKASTATLQGATLTLKRVERNAEECVYFIEISDPGYIDGVAAVEVSVPVEE